MADKTTERLQKDLMGYSEHYTDQLETLIGSRMQELAPEYRRLQAKAIGYLEQLNREVETASAEKLLSKRFQQRIQQMYVTQILPDLELLNASQQPYFTEVLAGTLQYGYYTAAYSLEQAAKVAVTVPLLNRAGVLGIIANPWLPDKKTYSDRIRANVQLVADKTTETVKDLVTKRLSYNEAARALRGQIGESYYNATRLIRTEMTRANALGASYAAMENADILDGKYRDATRDKKTSAKCAADADYSRTNLYPLDYDTPANPGIPGKRIPNHPHCRCRWCTVLSAVGVKARQKTARAEDGPNSFGKSYFTDEATYDGYAKERGLPSVKEMLEADNPKRYLRPGETVESLKKRVKRYKVGENTIVASIAPWDTAKVTTAVESGILKAETAKQKVINEIKLQPWTNGIKVEDQTELWEVFAKASDADLAFWSKHGGLIKGNFYDRTAGGHYAIPTKTVHLNIDKIDARSTRVGTKTDIRLFFHETGHLFDYNAVPGSSIREQLPDLLDKLKSDALAYSNKMWKASATASSQHKEVTTFYRLGKDKAREISQDLMTDPHIKNAVSDLFEGITDARIAGHYGHGKTYWGRPYAVEKEAIAHMVECTMMKGERLDTFKAYFPTAYDYFVQYFSTL